MSTHNLGTLKNRATFSNKLSAGDRLDSLQFRLARTSSFNIGVGGLLQNVQLQLFRSTSSGLSRIGSSNHGGIVPESLSFKRLKRGNYVARIQALTKRKTPYQVGLSRHLPSDVIAEEQTWNAVSTAPNAYQGNLNSKNTSDFFRLNLSATTPLNLGLRGLSKTAGLRLVQDKNGNGFIDSGEIVASSGARLSDHAINLRSLTNGTYYIQVHGSAKTAYTWGLSPATQSDLAVNEFALGTLPGAVLTRTGGVSDADTSDIYGFNLANPNHLSISLTNFVGDADVRIARDVNSNGLIETPEMISYSARRRAGLDESITLNNLAAGSYLVQVSQHAGVSNYTMRLSTGYPTDLLPMEYTLGNLSGTATFDQYIGSGTYYQNAADNIQFTLTSPRTVNLTLAGITSDIDLRLVRDINGNGIVDGSDEITRSSAGSDGAEWISRSLPAGTYVAQVYRYANNPANSHYYFSASTGDWYSNNLTDAGIIGMARYFDTKTYSRRYEVMNTLRAAKDYGNVDGTEVSDLRTFVNGRRSTMPDYVYNLAYKVVNSNPANQWWTGGASSRSTLGNLYAGASAEHLEKLIGKWFLGLDRPSAASGTTYRSVSGSLFRNGIAYQDVVQGGLGDCYFCAALAGTAFRSASRIQNMFIDNGDGTYTVRYYNNGTPDYVTVDRYLPANASGGAYYMGWGGGSYSSSNNELWAALAEKAYAQINESGWLEQDNTNTYSGIASGFTNLALRQITAQSTVDDWSLTDSDRTNVINQFNAGRTLLIDSLTHSYTIVGYNSSSQLFTIYNPWGFESTRTWNEILNGGGGWPQFVRWFYSTS
jgi:hypothetical protein